MTDNQLTESWDKVFQASQQAVSSKPITAGFFGLSQAGKSFLISALAADQKGNLETIFDGQQLDFIKHINPPGGGKEATGLVTRFTRSAKAAVPGYPLELRLFHEIEVAKILVNAISTILIKNA